jgi:hypothetical protein
MQCNVSFNAISKNAPYFALGEKAVTLLKRPPNYWRIKLYNKRACQIMQSLNIKMSCSFASLIFGILYNVSILISHTERARDECMVCMSFEYEKRLLILVARCRPACAQLKIIIVQMSARQREILII